MTAKFNRLALTLAAFSSAFDLETGYSTPLFAISLANTCKMLDLYHRKDSAGTGDNLLWQL